LVFIDPDGRSGQSTIVTENEDGTYNVTGGDATDGDLGIYVDNGQGGKGRKIGESVTPYSFFDDDILPVIGATIDLSSSDGQNFIDGFIEDIPSITDYMVNATEGEAYDYKLKGLPEDVGRRSEEGKQYKYRGSVLSDGKIASARDVGNMLAGYVSANYGLPWWMHRLGTDALESYQKAGKMVIGGVIDYELVRMEPVYHINWRREGLPTTTAQRVGYEMGLELNRIHFNETLRNSSNDWGQFRSLYTPLR
jgi:hypothetical protein